MTVALRLLLGQEMAPLLGIWVTITSSGAIQKLMETPVSIAFRSLAWPAHVSALHWNVWDCTRAKTDTKRRRATDMMYIE